MSYSTYLTDDEEKKPRTYLDDIADEENKKKKYEDYAASSAYLNQASAGAKSAQEAAINNANTAYAQQKATYGTRAESMSNMGLTGGGYSDYLSAQAYAQQRADTAAANSQYETTMRNARYQDYVDWKNEQEKIDSNIKAIEDEYKTNYATLLAGTKDGSITGADLDTLAAKYGVTPEDLETLKTSATTYESGIQNNKYLELRSLISSEKLSTYEALREAEALGITDQALLNKIKADATEIGGGIDERSLPKDENGNIDTNSTMYKDFNETQAKFVTPEMFNDKSFDDATKTYEEVINSPAYSDEIKNDVEKYYKEHYGTFGVDKTVPVEVEDLDASNKNDNFKIFIDGTKYKVQINQSAGKEISQQLKNRYGENAENGTLAVVDTNNYVRNSDSSITKIGTLYICIDKKWYKVENHTKGTGDYSSLLTAVGGKKTFKKE